MVTGRLASVFTVVAILICLAVMGIPWSSSSPLANFSGQITFESSDGVIDCSGHITFYGLNNEHPNVQMNFVVHGADYQVDVDRLSGAFSGSFDLGSDSSIPLEAYLKINGQVVARGMIDLPPKSPSRVHIIRFASRS